MISSEFLVVSMWFVHNISFPTGKIGRLLFSVMAFKAEIPILPSLNGPPKNLVQKKLHVTSRVVC